MNQIQEQVRSGMLLNFIDGSSWRLFTIIAPMCYLIKANETKRVIIELCITDIESRMVSGDITIAEDQLIRIVDETTLRRNRTEFNSFENKKGFAKEIKEQFGPTYKDLGSKKRDKEYRNIFRKYNMSRTLANRTIRRWLQSGMQDSSLVSKTYNGERKGLVYTTKTGRPGGSTLFRIDEYAEAFEYGLSLIRKNRLLSISKAYSMILSKYYTIKGSDKIEYVPKSERPSETQFRRYVKKCLSTEEMLKIKTSDREYRNNERIIKGAASYKAGVRPGFKIEVDELECDLQLVMRNNRQQCIGRPGIYAAIDVYSHNIVGFAVCLETNSNLGLSNLFLNIFEDKKQLLESKGIFNFDYSLWPSNFIPNTIRTDNGSDFVSKQTREICNRLGITIETVEPGMGSLKGNVEQSFKRFHDSIKAETFHLGFMEKRHDSNHYKEACLTLDEVFVLMLNFLVYNNSFYTKGRYLTPKMIDEGTTKTPLSIWNYGIKHYGNPEIITPMRYNDCFYNLMVEETATISRKGIIFEGLEYLPPVNDNYLLTRISSSKLNGNKKDADGNKLNSMTVRRDPRSVDNLYYVQNNEVKALTLKGAFADFQGKSWSYYESYRKKVKEMDSENKDANEMLRAQSIKTVTSVVDMSRTLTYADKINLKESRLIEKEEDNYNNRIATRLNIPQTLPDSANDPKQVEESKECGENGDNDFPRDYDRGGLSSESIKKIMEEAWSKK